MIQLFYKRQIIPAFEQFVALNAEFVQVNGEKVHMKKSV